MAWEKKRKNSEHAYKRIQNDLKENSLKNLLFFFGREQYLADWSLNAVLEKYINPVTKELDFTEIEGEATSFEEIRNSCETMPMMSERRVVHVKGFAPIEGGKLKGFGENEENNLVKYMGNLPETTLLIFTAKAADKRKKLYKTVEKAGSAYEFTELDEKLLKGFIEKRLKSAGKTARSAVISEFIAISGYYDKDGEYTLFNLENDVKKAIAHSDGPEVVREDFLGTVTSSLDTNVFAMIDAVSQNRKDEAFSLLHNLLFSGEKEFRILALIVSQLEIILSVKEMKEEGFGFEKMKETLNIHEFRIKKAFSFSQRYTLPRLRKALSTAYGVDRNIKTGMLEAQLALEMFIASL